MPAKGPLGSSGRLPGGGGGRGGSRGGGGGKPAPKYKKKEIPNVRTGEYDVRTKRAAKGLAQLNSATKQKIKEAIRSGEIAQPARTPKGVRAISPNASRMKPVPKKPSARQMSSKRRGNK